MPHKRTNDESKPYDKSIRKRLTRTVLIPSVTLLLVAIATSSYFIFNGLYLRLVAVSVREVSIPAATALAAVQTERQIALRYIDNPSLDPSSLQAQQKTTDGKLAVLQSAFAANSAPDEIAPKVNALRSQLEQLPVMRSQINFRSIQREQVNGYYNGVLDTASDLFDTQARVVPDAQAAHGGITATAVFRAGDMMSRETSLISTAFAARTFTPDDFAQFTQLAGFYRTQLGQISPYLDATVREKYDALTASEPWKQLQNAEQALTKRGPWKSNELGSIPVTDGNWQNITSQVAQQLNALAIDQADKVSAAAIDSGNAQLRNAILGSLAALLISAIAIIVAVRVSRSLVDRTLMTRLARLRDDSLDLASNRLPDIVHRLKNSEAVDIQKELPQLDHGKDEIGQVAEAFNTAQLTAVNAAASEAKARSGVHNVFLGIAHRNQVLVHQQLQILDEMEDREEDPTQLASLFRLDHLAARARRTTENLIILGGGQPGRRWRKPVPLMDVLRAAVSETEHYPRVQVDQVADVAIVGAAVADTIHLIAELVDNATSFSPPESKVEVTSRLVARGVVVDVSDHGFGMKDEALQRANMMMDRPPEFDAMALRADTTLGLFVVARLSAKLGTNVHFDRSRYGGLRVTVLIPALHLAERQPEGQANNVEFVPSGVPVPAPAVAHAGQPQEQPARHMDASTLFTPQVVPAAHERKPRPYPAHALVTPPDSAAGTPSATSPGGRPKLPQRRPQQNLVAQLRDEPAGDGTMSDVPSANESARSLAAFHRGSSRGRADSIDS